MHEELTPEERDRLFSAAYEELRRLASQVRHNDRGATLNPTALVHEAYVKLAASLRLRPASELHFKRLTARAMRQVLVEAARRRNASKRGGEAVVVTFDEQRDGTARPEELIALDAALEALSRMDARQALLVECRFFGGFDVEETARILGVSPSTVDRGWRAARAWLSMEMRRSG